MLAKRLARCLSHDASRTRSRLQDPYAGLALDRTHAPRGYAARDAPRHPWTQSVRIGITTQSVGTINEFFSQYDEPVGADEPVRGCDGGVTD